jgi:hypothetical protein
LKPRLSIDLHGREVRVDDLNSSSLSNFDAFGEPCLDDAQVNHIAHCHDLGRRRQRDRERERERGRDEEEDAEESGVTSRIPSLAEGTAQSLSASSFWRLFLFQIDRSQARLPVGGHIFVPPIYELTLKMIKPSVPGGIVTAFPSQVILT